MNRRLFLTVLAAGLVAPTLALAGGSEKAKGGTETTVAFPPLTATVLRLDGRRGVLTVEITVDAPDAALRQRVEQSRPLLRDAWNTVINRQTATLRPGTAPDVERLATALQTACDRVLGRPGAHVLLGSVIVN